MGNIKKILFVIWLYDVNVLFNVMVVYFNFLYVRKSMLLCMIIMLIY